MSDVKLRLYNTLTRSKEVFDPIDPKNVRMYVCGPTVYDFAHIGNARPAIVFDVLFRLLRHVYGEEHVTYVRNITDVDDKINARALRDFGEEIEAGTLTLNQAIRKVTEKTDNQYQKDVTALGCLPPTFQPRATEFVQRDDGKTDMIGLIQSLIERGHAYEAAGEVLFDTASMKDYGQLSKRPLDEQIAGARVEVDRHKKNPGDFVLWKLSSPEEPGWDSPWGRGRPGWHIECSAMSAAYLGEVFDIHGGGLDLIFPHHENEIAQSRCAFGHDVMANYWMHNGFLQVEGQKMSKSLGNFFSIHELLETESFGGRKWPGEVLRLAMLMTHYREPIDFSVRRLEEAAITLLRLFRKIKKFELAMMSDDAELLEIPAGNDSLVDASISEALADDLNVGATISIMQKLNVDNQVDAALRLIGIDWRSYVRREKAELAERWNERDVEIRRHTSGFTYEGPEIASSHKSVSIDDMIAERLTFIREKNWAEADRIRDELLAQGIQLKDGKDPATGERVTTWEVKR
ncbi:MAG: cysteine--tRNA ligase [Rhizobiaceae bacterium]